MIEKARLAVPLPTESPIMLQVALTDDRGLLVSTPHQILAAMPTP